MRLPPLLMLFLLAAGCTYSKAMESGIAHQQSGAYASALDAYALALAEKPGDPEATQRVAQIREAQADAAIARAEGHMKLAQYEEALSALADVEAIDDDRPEVFVITQKARAELEAGFKGLVATNRLDDAYDMAVRTRRLFGNRSYLNKGLLDLRSHYQSEARAAYEAGDYLRALKNLDAITNREPEQQAPLASQRHAIRTGWADKHAAIAHDLLRSGNPGGAAASFLKAHAIAQRPADRNQADQTLATLASEGALTFVVRSASKHPRDLALRELLNARLTALPDTAERAQSPALAVELLPSPFQCADSVVRTPQTRPYKAGTVAVPHPDFLAATAEIEAHQRAAAGAKRQADALWAVMMTLGPRLQESQEEMVQLLTSQPALEAAVAEAEVKRALAESTASPSLDAWTQALADRTKSVADLQARIAELEAENAPLQTESATAEAQVQEAMAAAKEAEQAAAAAAAKRDAGPQTIDREVDDTLHYDLEDWTRECKAELTVRLRPSWPTSLPTTAVHTHAASTQDQAHIGSEAAALEENPKAYPESDEQLLAKVDTQNLDALTDWLTAVTDEHFRVRTTAAAITMSSSPRDGTTEALRLLLGAPDRLDPAALPLFDQQIRNAWDLEASLLPDATPTTDAPEPGPKPD